MSYYIVISCFPNEAALTMVAVRGNKNEIIPALMACPPHVRFMTRQMSRDVYTDSIEQALFTRYRAYFGIWDGSFRNLYPHNTRAARMLPSISIHFKETCRGNVIVTGPDGNGMSHTEASFLVMTMSRVGIFPTYTSDNEKGEHNDESDSDESESWRSVDNITLTKHDLEKPMPLVASSSPRPCLREIWAGEL